MRLLRFAFRVVLAAVAGSIAPAFGAEAPSEPAVHLALRCDGRDGTGTRRDPRNATGAARLDSLWLTLPAGATIRFGRGKFETERGLALKKGQHVMGQGPRRTTLRLASGALPAGDYPTSAPLQRILLWSEAADGNNHVRGICIDGNRDRQGAYAARSPNVFLGAVHLRGLDCSIRRLRYVRGFSSSDSETFPIGIEGVGGTLAAPARGLIERVVVEEHDGYNTSISLLAQTRGAHPVTGGHPVTASAGDGVFMTTTPHGCAEGDEVLFLATSGGAGLAVGRSYFVVAPTATSFRIATVPGGAPVRPGSDLTAGLFCQPTWITGAIRDCKVTGRKRGGYSKTIAFGCGGWLGVELRGNRAEDVFIGINTDTHSYRGVWILDNRFSIRADPAGMQGFGVFLGGGFSWENYLIRGNTFKVSRNAAALALNGNVRGLRFQGNVIRRDGDAGGACESVSVRSTGNAGLELLDNHVAPGIRFTAPPGMVTRSTGNRMTNGARLQEWPEVPPQP